MEEGSSLQLRDREFGLTVGEPAEFRFFQSAVRKNDAAGAMLDDAGADLEELSPIEVCLPASGNAGEFVPVTLETVVTETGMLQLWSVARDGRRWKLESETTAIGNLSMPFSAASGVMGLASIRRCRSRHTPI